MFDIRVKIKPEMCEIFVETIRVVGTFFRLAGNGEQLFPGIRQAAACPADLHDFPKLDQFKIIDLLGILWAEQVRKRN